MATRVLIAEDEWIVAAALRRQLQASGYDVVDTVSTGTAVLERCRPDEPDIVLMDVQMPEMDGLTATRRLMTTCPHPVAIVTGNGSLRQAAEEAGAMEYVVKPVLTHQLPEIIGRAQERFCRFACLRRETGSCERALAAWPGVQRAVRYLAEAEALSEEQAFARLQELAAQKHLPLREAAAQVMAGQ